MSNIKNGWGQNWLQILDQNCIYYKKEERFFKHIFPIKIAQRHNFISKFQIQFFALLAWHDNTVYSLYKLTDIWKIKHPIGNNNNNTTKNCFIFDNNLLFFSSKQFEIETNCEMVQRTLSSIYWSSAETSVRKNAENEFRYCNECMNDVCVRCHERAQIILYALRFRIFRFTQTYLYKTEQQIHTIRLSVVVIHLPVVATGKKNQIQIFCFLCLSLCRNWKINDIFGIIFQSILLCACVNSFFLAFVLYSGEWKKAKLLLEIVRHMVFQSKETNTNNFHSVW